MIGKIPIAMTIRDAYSIYDTMQLVSATGVQKAKQRIDYMVIKAFLAGALISFGGLFLLIVGGESASTSTES